MAKNGFKAIDSDMHLVEPLDLWQRYIDPAFRDRAPKGLKRFDATRPDVSLVLEGQLLPLPCPSAAAAGVLERVTLSQNEKYSDVATREYDGVSQVWAMDKEGLDVAVLYPTRGLFALAVDNMDPAPATAISRAYNDWLCDFCQASPQRMFGAAMVPPHDVEGAALEARRAVRELGFKAVFLRPNHVNGRLWSDPYYDPLWSELEDLGVPVGFHEGGRVPLPQLTLKEYAPSVSMFQVLSFPMGNMLACVDMISGGVLERYPGLKVGFLEGNCSWVPWLLWRMEEMMEVWGKYEYPDLKLEPLEYFQRQCYASIDADELTAKHLPEFGLEDRIVFSTDYPHGDARYPHAVEMFLEMPLSEEFKRKVLWDNCARLYGL